MLFLRFLADWELLLEFADVVELLADVLLRLREWLREWPSALFWVPLTPLY